ncbi:hypothetical protein D9613_009408 [Agrocybe pediades]|uniref:DUF6533 domain-containing protein n=1 Tax=Agrocybe pediades TaxID=84607 RepID=A0A8H4R2E6_9AGAR|nr:hypothetical protein D9613_009408 [Agrocybe pediades]
MPRVSPAATCPTFDNLMTTLASAVTIIAVDHVLTFGQEVDLIWSQKFSLGTALFLINRYFGFATAFATAYGLVIPSSTDK